jgi:hypothetical protein
VRVIQLPIEGITVTLDGQGGAVTSDLDRGKEAPESTEDLDEEGACDAYKDALYTLMLAHAQAGIDVTTPEYLTGVQAVVDTMTKAL